MFARVYPGIGIGRVGNSPTEIFIGPEAPGLPRSTEDPFAGEGPFKYKDAQGRVKRQATRFRVYLYKEDQRGKGYDAVPDRELTYDDPEVLNITWKVTLANKKGSSYKWMLFNKPTQLKRNPTVKDRSTLEIRPSSKSVQGRSVNFAGGNPRLQFDDGAFLGEKVNLGELRTDPYGRLVVCGGYGLAKAVPGAGDALNVEPYNNTGWYDDTSDGPVQCTINLADGQTIIAEQASVQIAPPKYAPSQLPVTSFYDTMKEIAEDRGYLSGRGNKCVYYRDIHPILSAAVQHIWVSEDSLKGHRERFSRLEIPDFSTHHHISKHLSDSVTEPLSDLSPKSIEEQHHVDHQVLRFNADRDMRRKIFRRIRKPFGLATTEERKLQAAPEFMPHPARTLSSVTISQYKKLEMWAEGDFTLGTPGKFGTTFNSNSDSDIPLPQQSAALDRAGLEHASSHALNPGVEFDISMTSNGVYKSAFRVDDQLIGPGDIGIKMPLPWQCDFWTCYNNWWPTSHPDHVIPETEYKKVDPSEADGNSFPRVFWDRGMTGMKSFVDDDNWAKCGFITPMPGRDGFRVYVEAERDPELEKRFGSEPGIHPERDYIRSLYAARDRATL